MDDTCHLTVIIDSSPQQWYKSAAPPTSAATDPLSFEAFMPQLLAFLNAHLALKHENTLSVIGAYPGKSVILYSSEDPHESIQPDPNTYQPFKAMNTLIMERQHETLTGLANTKEPIALVASLTKALCYINKLVHPPPPSNPSIASPIPPICRILIVSVSEDTSSAYIPIMNSIFSAQKLKATIDVCKLYGPSTVFLQQAAHLTGGSYLSIKPRQALLQYLFTCFLPPTGLRRLMAVPTEDKVDFRAACFCHKKIIDVGFICSMCLSIFCNPVPICTTCRSKFPMASLKRLKEALKPKHLAEAAGTLDGSSPAGGTPRSPADVGSPQTNGISNGGSGGCGKGRPHGPSGLSTPWAPGP